MSATARKWLRKPEGTECKRETNEYDCPSENCSLFIFRIIQPSSLEGFRCLDHEKTGLVVAAEGVVVETLGPLCKSLRRKSEIGR